VYPLDDTESIARAIGPSVTKRIERMTRNAIAMKKAIVDYCRRDRMKACDLHSLFNEAVLRLGVVGRYTWDQFVMTAGDCGVRFDKHRAGDDPMQWFGPNVTLPTLDDTQRLHIRKNFETMKARIAAEV
jgi:hypothetical protein